MTVTRRINPHARRLRREATDVEQLFWLAVRDRRLAGFKFRRQASIGPFVVDFLCVERRLVVELDGGQHGGADDERRTGFLEQAGYRVLRFWNNDVLGTGRECSSPCSQFLRPRASQPHPTLSRQRERARNDR